MSEKRTIFITGATGLLGSYLLKIFLENGHKVFALARGQNAQEASERVIKKIKFWDEKVSAKNLSVLVGDITKENLGLDSKTLDKLKSEVDEIFHCAAAINLDWPLDKIRLINVNGTQNLLNLGCEWSKKFRLKKISHISTAYVCGDYKGEFKENDLDCGQGFVTTYEQSKFEAEKLVEEYRKKGLWIDIFRSSIIVGDSKFGKITRFQNIYHFIYSCSLGIFDSLPILNTYASLVPVDHLCEAIYIINENSTLKNQIYHPFPTRPMSIEGIVEAASKIGEFKKPKSVSKEEFQIDSLTPVQKSILKATILAFNSDIKFNSNYTNSVLTKYNYNLPLLDKESFSRILRYFFKIKGSSRKEEYNATRI
jgi:long-chain acyl-CoA synthetase